MTTASELKDRILALELLQNQQSILLKEQLHLTRESITPGAIVKRTLTGLTESTGLKTVIFKTGLSLIAAYLVKKMVSKGLEGLIEKLFTRNSGRA